MFPRYNAVYTDHTLTVVSHLIATDGPGKGFRLEKDPAIVRRMARQFGEVSIHDAATV